MNEVTSWGYFQRRTCLYGIYTAIKFLFFDKLSYINILFTKELVRLFSYTSLTFWRFSYLLLIPLKPIIQQMQLSFWPRFTNHFLISYHQCISNLLIFRLKVLILLFRPTGKLSKYTWYKYVYIYQLFLLLTYNFWAVIVETPNFNNWISYINHSKSLFEYKNKKRF